MKDSTALYRTFSGPSEQLRLVQNSILRRLEQIQTTGKRFVKKKWPILGPLSVGLRDEREHAALQNVFRSLGTAAFESESDCSLRGNFRSAGKSLPGGNKQLMGYSDWAEHSCWKTLCLWFEQRKRQQLNVTMSTTQPEVYPNNKKPNSNFYYKMYE
ncbi:unnamed protein product [Adineta ricciae]|uniref:Uncharacterized protein n=1 Tax=Adineta ricciae TaxID=249248 RepID=A0A815L5Y5_ADIRI|nr:unnamed protein product [Adineta ricciae]CAF1445258.1 unnamed protein product [Adineta ricciae]